MTPTLKTINVRDESSIYAHLENRFGKVGAAELVDAYQAAYWTTQDFDNVRALGANCIRLPFWYPPISSTKTAHPAPMPLPVSTGS